MSSMLPKKRQLSPAKQISIGRVPRLVTRWHVVYCTPARQKVFLVAMIEVHQ